MERIVGALVRWKWLVIIVTLALTAYLGYHVRYIRFDSSSEGSVPRGDPSQEYFEEVKDDFGNDQVAMLVVLSKSDLGVFEPATLAKIKRLTDSIGTFDGVDNVVSLTNSTFIEGVGDELRNDPIVPRLPETREEAEQIRRDVLANPVFHKTLVSEDGRAAAINIFLANETDSVLQATGIDGKITNITVDEAGPEELIYGGFIHTRMEINKAMHADLKTFIPLSFLLILLILYLSFRTLKGVVLPASAVVISVVCTFGLAGLFNVPLNMTMTIIPPLLIAIASSLAIYIVSAYLDAAPDGKDRTTLIKETFASHGGALITCGVTTAIGFGSLMVSPIPNLQKVGLFSCVGIIIAMLAGFTFIPAVLAVTKLPKRKAEEAEEAVVNRVVNSIVSLVMGHRWLTLAVVLVIVVVSAFGAARIRIDTDFISYFKEGSEVRRAARIIGENLAGVSTFYVIVSSDEADVMRRSDVLRGVDSLQRTMESHPHIDKATSFVNILKLFHKAMNEDHPDSNIVTASQEVLDEEILLTIDQEEPRVRSHYVVEDYSSMAVFARSQLVSTSELVATIEQVEALARSILPEGVRVAATGTVVVLAQTIDSIAQGQRDSLLSAVGLVFLIIAYLFRSIKVGLISMIPNLVPIVIMFGIMGWFNIPLNIGTSIVASISLGIAVDDTIHLMMHVRSLLAKGMSQREAVTHTVKELGKPIVYTGLTMALGFSVICFSDFGMLSSVGILSSVTMLICVTSDLFLTPALLLTFNLSGGLKAKAPKA